MWGKLHPLITNLKKCTKQKTNRKRKKKTAKQTQKKTTKKTEKKCKRKCKLYILAFNICMLHCFCISFHVFCMLFAFLAVEFLPRFFRLHFWGTFGRIGCCMASSGAYVCFLVTLSNCFFFRTPAGMSMDLVTGL